MADKEKKTFVKPKLIKFDKPLSEVIIDGSGTGPCNSGGASKSWSWFEWWNWWK
jgi:hypothetical protein